MRIMVKGGVWKNTEDEILKAAVMKYGKNQWARISSLLTRKSAKQCKARWYEWIDPAIKKTEWSKEEEEKLLHLAKIMPNQWKTIAAIIGGRTSSMCLEHYEKILDAAQSRDNYEPTEDPRRLRPGEIDPNPEGKPARPDPVDMDEDEKEMLSEARARLANTKGKKAKRKAREKQLEEARRLASLQKRRELKAAGIDLPRHRRRLKGVDYNKEIPFQRKPPPGFYEVDWEAERQKQQSEGFKRITLDQLDPKRKRDADEEERRKEYKKMRLAEQKNLPQVIAQVNKLNEPPSISSRGKLVLPSPQLDEKNLEELAKLEEQGEAKLVSQLSEGGSSVTQGLLPSYSATPARTPLTLAAAASAASLKTPIRTPMREDIIAKEAQNLVALTNVETPLMGGENPLLHASDFSGSAPKAVEVRTPHVLATPGRASTSKGGMMTPLRTPGRTPLRDSLSVSEDMMDDSHEKKKNIRDALRKGLLNLPAPQNEYSIQLPESVEEEELEDANNQNDIETDASDELEKARKEEKERLAAKLRLRSQVLQRNFPRPYDISAAYSEYKSKNANAELAQAEDMLRKEVTLLIAYEAIEYPFKQSLLKEELPSTFDEFTEQEIVNAKKLLQEELDEMNRAHNPNGFSQEVFDKAYQECLEEWVFVPSQNKYVRANATQKKDKLESISHEFDAIKKQLDNDATKSKTKEQKVNVYTMGYQKRAQTLQQQISTMLLEIQQKRMELECFGKLRELESEAIPNRIAHLQRLVKEQEERESALQQRFLTLNNQKQDFLEKLMQQRLDQAPVNVSS